MYRNRDSQMVRLNKVDVFIGQAAIPGLYCCTPNNDGILHRIIICMCKHYEFAKAGT